MNEILKAAVVQQQAVGPEELALINKQSLRELAADEEPGRAGGQPEGV